MAEFIRALPWICLILYTRPRISSCTNDNCLPETPNLDGTTSYPSGISDGLYVDINNPATCSGQFMQWELCYNPDILEQGRTYHFGLQIWRLEEGSRNGMIVGGQSESIDPSSRSGEQCVTYSRDEDTPEMVTEGDVLAVYLTGRVLSVLSTNLPNTSLLRVGAEAFPPDSVSGGEWATVTGNKLQIRAIVQAQVTAPPQETPVQQTASPSPTQTIKSATTVTTTTTTTIISTPTVNTVLNTTTTIPSATTTTTTTTTTASSTMPSLETNMAAIIGITVCLAIALAVLCSLILCYFFKRSKKKKDQHIAGGGGGGSAVLGNGAAVLGHDPLPGLPTGKVKEIVYENPVSNAGITVSSAIPYARYSVMESGPSATYEIPLVAVNQVSAEQYYESMCPITGNYDELLNSVVGGRRVESVPYFMPGENEEAIYKQLQSQGIKKIPISDIRLLERLAIGHFGDIHKGDWYGPSNFRKKVAIKMLNQGAVEADRLRMLQEVAMMAQFRHPNLIALYGISNRATSQIMIIMEYAPCGNLCDHLKRLRPKAEESITANFPQVLLNFCQQICLGMDYLSQKGFIHRGLQTRNILLEDNDICKISDFGKSRDLSDSDYYVSSGGELPIPWTAPEAIQYRKFSTASDVWSFGCVLYEIWSLGHEPFEGIEKEKIFQLLEDYFRLPPPPGCPLAIYSVMIECWAPKSEVRPKFQVILRSLMGVTDLVPKRDSVLCGSFPSRDLGASLEAGRAMYTALQNKYKLQSM